MGRAFLYGVGGGAAPAPTQIKENDVNFYDYDGTLVAAYSAADFAALSAMPENPSHTGLVAEGWNWTLANAKTYVAANGKLNIGQMYHTESGKTEYDIVVDEASGFTATLNNSAEKDWGDGTVDTNTSHTYASAGSYTIKMGGTSLPTIQNSKKVRAVKIASGVTSIGSYVFNSCRALQSATIPSGVTSIADGAFVYCYSLQWVTIPSGVTSIGSITFQYCYSLQIITIPSTVRNIGGNAFQNCYSLQSITIPSGVTSIGNSVFQNCDSLHSITIPSGVTGFDRNAFYYCYSLQSITIPSSVTSIGQSAFSYCYSLQSVTIPSGVTSFGLEAFSYCHSLQSITIASSVTSIGASAFYSCSWLSIVTVLATTPPTLGNANVFPSNVTKIYIPNGTLATYQAATNWSTYSSKFVELPA